MKRIFFAIIILILSISKGFTQTDCTQNQQAQTAKQNMSSAEDGIMCANAAQFYAYLCECQSNPRTAEQARNLKATLEQIKASYNNYGSPCAGIGQIKDAIPNCKVGEGGGSSSLQNPELVGNRPVWMNQLEGVKVKERAANIANEYALQVSQIGNLSNTSNPDAFINEFNEKIQQLENLNQSFNAERLNTALEGLQNFQSAANTGNEADFYRGIGAAAGLYDMMEARKVAKAKEKRLYQQRRQQMSNYYWDALDRTNEQIDEFELLAAYAETQAMEDYYLFMIDNLECFKEAMEENWSMDHTIWLNNYCLIPAKPGEQLPNNLISKERYYLNLAKNKYKKYIDTRIKAYGFGFEFKPIYYKDITWPADVGAKERIKLSYSKAAKRYGEKKYLFREEISKVLPNSPADKAGFLAGNRISGYLDVSEIPFKPYNFGINFDENKLLRDFDSLNTLQFIVSTGVDNLAFEAKTLEKDVFLYDAEPFRQSAIAFASKAATINPSAANHYTVAKYAEEENTVLAMTHLLAAHAIDPDYISGERSLYYNYVQALTSSTIKKAIEKNDTEYIDLFINAGLNHHILIDGEDIFVYAIKKFKPELVQRILNKYLENADDSQRTALSRDAVVFCVKLDSYGSLKRLMELGVDTNFLVDGKDLKTIAQEYQSNYVLQLLE